MRKQGPFYVPRHFRILIDLQLPGSAHRRLPGSAGKYTAYLHGRPEEQRIKLLSPQQADTSVNGS